MYQKIIIVQKGLLAIAVAVAMSSGSASAANTVEGCARTILKQAQGFAQKKANALRKCEDGVLKAKVTGPCPDTKNADKIAVAMTKALEKIAKKCEGFDTAGVHNRDCNGVGDPAACCTGAEAGTCFPANLGYGDNCPRAACAGPLDTVPDLADCVVCNASEVTDELASAAYAPLTAPSSDKDVLGCQRTIGKEVVAAYRKISKAKQKCEDGMIKGKVAGCPDAKTGAKINKTLAKLSQKISKKCPDQSVVDAAVNPAGIFGVFGSLAGAGDAAEAFAETQVQVSLNQPVCGNASIESGEDCDDGNRVGDTGSGPADICPSDCAIAACSPVVSRQVTVNFTSSALIGDMTILLAYDDSRVQIPGNGNTPAVNAVLSSTSFSFTPNDLDYGLRMVLLDATFSGVPSGEAFVVQFDTCAGSPELTSGDFQCFVASAADPEFAPLTDATCSVVVSP